MKKLVTALVGMLALIGCAAELGKSGIPGDDGLAGDAGAPGPAGEAGANGETGPPGERGPAGPSGNDAVLGKITTTYKCDFGPVTFGAIARLSDCTDSPVSANVWYYAAEMASGDVLVRAGVDVITQGDVDGNSSSYLWPAGSAEALSGKNWVLQKVCHGVMPTHDGNWSFSLNKAGRVLTTTYVDSVLTAGSVTYLMPCTVANF